MIKGEIWEDLEELRADYSLRAEKYRNKAELGLKQEYYTKLWKKYSLANEQLYNILHCGKLGKIMEGE